MAELAVVRRYARALFDTAQKAGSVEQVEQDLRVVDQVLREVPRLQRVLRAPTVAGVRKQELLGHTFGARVSPLTLRFLHLAITRRREQILPDIYTEFRTLANELRNILPVHVTAAVPLTDPEREALTSALAGRLGKTIQLQVSVDPTLIGGLTVRLGDTVIDGSVRTRLNQLRERLLGPRAATVI